MGLPWPLTQCSELLCLWFGGRNCSVWLQRLASRRLCYMLNDMALLWIRTQDDEILGIFYSYFYILSCYWSLKLDPPIGLPMQYLAALLREQRDTSHSSLWATLPWRPHKSATGKTFTLNLLRRPTTGTGIRWVTKDTMDRAVCTSLCHVDIHYAEMWPREDTHHGSERNGFPEALRVGSWFSKKTYPHGRIELETGKEKDLLWGEQLAERINGAED